MQIPRGQRYFHNVFITRIITNYTNFLLATCYLLLGSWFLLLASWFLVFATCFLVLGFCFLVLGFCYLLLGSWFLLLGSCFPPKPLAKILPASYAGQFFLFSSLQLFLFLPIHLVMLILLQYTIAWLGYRPAKLFQASCYCGKVFQ
jgi:hypothetical protein